MDDAAQAARDLDELRIGIEFGDLAMEYQPIVDIRSRTAVAFEALARWRHPERGIVPAADFVPVLDESDLVVELARLSLNQACHVGAALQSAGHDVGIHVNLSLRHLALADAVEDVGRALSDAGLPAGLLALEVPAGLPPARSSFHDKILALRDLGVAIAISIGGDNATFSRSADLEVDVIKLDRSIVADVDSRRSARAACAGVLAMSRHLGVVAIAEGIETEAELDVLLDLGYRRAQGNLFSAALPRKQLAGWA